MTLGQLLANTTSQELSEWQAYFRVENERLEEARDKQKTPGKVTADNPKALSAALKAQLAPYKTKGG